MLGGKSTRKLLQVTGLVLVAAASVISSRLSDATKVALLKQENDFNNLRRVEEFLRACQEFKRLYDIVPEYDKKSCLWLPHA